MCRIDYVDSSPLPSQVRRARKPHRCDECRRIIGVGEVYERGAWVSDGIVGTSLTCAHCQVAREWLADVCGGWVYGEVLDELDEHRQEYRVSWAMVRLVAGMKHQWQRKGELTPVPERVPGEIQTPAPVRMRVAAGQDKGIR